MEAKCVQDLPKLGNLGSGYRGWQLEWLTAAGQVRPGFEQVLAWLNQEAMKQNWITEDKFNKKKEEIMNAEEDGDPEVIQEIEMTWQGWNRMEWKRIQKDLCGLLTKKTEG